MAQKNVLQSIRKISKDRKVISIFENEGKLIVCGNKNIVDKVSENEHIEAICNIMRV